MKKDHFTPIQEAAISLMQSDLKYLYTVIKRINPEESNYIPSLMPYMGVIVDGIEDWIKAFNNSSKLKLDVPIFSEAEQLYYEKMRDSIKLWRDDYLETYRKLENAYRISDEYFGNICKPIAKKLKLYDIYGVDKINEAICGNTILCYMYNPLFSYDGENGEYIKTMSEIGGKYIALFDATHEYQIKSSVVFDTDDYGGLVKSPVGNKFSDKFVLFSILCQINFIIYCVDEWITDEISTKMRFAYLLYYSLIHVVPQINVKLDINLKLDKRWENREFRNAMAHYKLGVSLKENELVLNDIFFGLTQKYFKEDYIMVKKEIISELKKLAIQIGRYLELNEKLICTKII